MLKKPQAYLNYDYISALPSKVAQEVDRGLNHSALFILKQLVHGGNALSQAYLRGSHYVLMADDLIAKPLTRSLKRQYLRAAYKKVSLVKFVKIIASIASAEISLEASCRMLDLLLQRLAFLVLKCFVVISAYGVRSLHEAYVGILECGSYIRNWRRSLPFFSALAKPTIYASILTTIAISATSNADVADEMKVLIEQRKAADAYALGAKHPELMGDPLFDYFFGVASVETGHTSMGVLSLERVLLNDPNNDLVRLELARAYYAQAEYVRAKDEFEAVKKNQPPAGVISTINTYLDDIKAKEAQYKPAYGVFVELGMGYNNNVNAATAVNNIILPYIGPITLGSSSLPQKSLFGYDSIGANVAVPITSDVSAFASASTSAQRYSQVNGYNLNVTNATTGVKIADGQNTYKIAGFGSIAQIDQVPVPNTYGGGGEYVRQLTDTDSIMIAAGSTVLQYPSQFNAYNSNLNIGTVGYRKAFPTTKWKPVVDISVNTAHQTDTSNRPDLGRRIAGGSIQASFLPADKVGVTIGAGYARSQYDANDLLYQTSRTDHLYSGNAVLQYKLTKELSARLEVTYYNNLSNLNLYGYEQWTGAVKLRYDWNSN